MDPKLTLDKKGLPRGASSRNGSDVQVKLDYARKGTQRKREDKLEYGKRCNPAQCGRSGQRVQRAREKVGGQVNDESDLSGEYPRIGHRGYRDISNSLGGWGPTRLELQHQQKRAQAALEKHRRKQQRKSCAASNKNAMQSRCQFVIPSFVDYSQFLADPDQIIEWDCIEGVYIHKTDPENCPICLYPPVAGQMTKCGHIFCFQCILHYLALSDEKWRKCPICFDYIMKTDLKSVKVVLQSEYNSNDEVTFSLMYRERFSTIPKLMSEKSDMPSTFSTIDNVSPHSRLVLATRDQIIDQILNQEYKILTNQYESEKNEPEACFIHEALNLLAERRLKVSAYPDQPDFNPLHELEKQLQSTSLANSGIEETSNNPSPKSIYHFYQAANGLLVYLNTLNVQMLVREYGSMENCPQTLRGIVIEKENNVMDENIRSRTRYLSHLSIGCPFDIVELQLTEPTISPNTLLEFKDRIEKRVRNRKRKEKEERKVERRAKEDEDKMMGRTTDRHRINVQLESMQEFPSFADDPPLPTLNESGATASNVTDRPSFREIFRSNNKTFTTAASAKPSNEHNTSISSVEDEDEEGGAPSYRSSMKSGIDFMLDQLLNKEQTNETKKKNKKKKNKRKADTVTN